MLDRNETAWIPTIGVRPQSPLGTRRVTAALIGILALCLAACGAQPEAEAAGQHDRHEAPKAEPAGGHDHDQHVVPADGIILEDLMQLMNMKFGTLRQEGGKIGVDAESKGNVLKATQNAQRYLRVAKKDFSRGAEFNAFADDAIAAWATLETAATAGDLAALKAGIQSLGATCKACHDVYREHH